MLTLQGLTLFGKIPKVLKTIDYDKYELIVGLEIHTQLKTVTKAYSADAYEYGLGANTQTCPISLGHPGTLPVPNKRVIDSGIKLGLALNCSIRERNEYARKNYFYADLPKGYQITQDKTPICTDGFIIVKDANGEDKRIGITRIHMEEDSGKSIHDIDPFESLIDLNRAGVPLLEIVSEPDFRSIEEAYNFLAEIRRMVKYLDICDGNMEEGSMRCDANISVRLRGEEDLRTRVEVKNMNSLRNVQRAIQYEAKRQIEVYENGGEVFQETRNYDAGKNITIVMRTKEDAHDYRYFPEPDIQPVYVYQKDVDKVKANMPALPSELFKQYVEEYKLSEYDAALLIEDKEIALYYGRLIDLVPNYKMACNYLMGTVKSYLNEKALTIGELPIGIDKLAELINLVDSGKVSHSAANQKLFPAVIIEPTADVVGLIHSLGIIQESDSSFLESVISEVISAHPNELERYKAGQKQLMGMFMGQVMKASKGKADPKITSKLLAEMLNKA